MDWRVVLPAQNPNYYGRVFVSFPWIAVFKCIHGSSIEQDRAGDFLKALGLGLGFFLREKENLAPAPEIKGKR